jgi:hypothetical protein
VHVSVNPIALEVLLLLLLFLQLVPTKYVVPSVVSGFLSPRAWESP